LTARGRRRRANRGSLASVGTRAIVPRVEGPDQRAASLRNEAWVRYARATNTPASRAGRRRRTATRSSKERARRTPRAPSRASGIAAGVREEQLLAADLVRRDRLLPLRRDEPVDELLPEIL